MINKNTQDHLQLIELYIDMKCYRVIANHAAAFAIRQKF